MNHEKLLDRFHCSSQLLQLDLFFFSPVTWARDCQFQKYLNILDPAFRGGKKNINKA